MRTALVLTLALAATPALAFTRDYDGEWAAEARTTVGACAPSAMGTVTIRGGRVVDSSEPNVAVWGYVDDKNDISARFTKDGHVFRASGKIKARGAHGAWSSNTDNCGGTWSAQRRK